MARSLLHSTTPPAVPSQRIRSSVVLDAVTDLSSGMQGTQSFLRALLVWLQQQLEGIRVGLFDSMVMWEPMVGLRNSVNTDFTILAGNVRIALNGSPQALLFQGGTQIPYTAGTPGPFMWTFVDTQVQPQTFVLGTPPTGVPLDEPIVALVVVQ